jgi:Sortase domain
MTKNNGRHASPERRVPAGSPPAAGPQRPRQRHRRLRTVSKWSAITVLGCGLLGSGIGACGLAVASKHPGHPARPASQAGPPPFVAIPQGKAAPVPDPSGGEKVARPVSLAIPAEGISTTLIHLGITKSGALQVPATTAVAGWYTSSPRPGAIGSSIIAGHIDSLAGAGIFYRLHLMKRGEKIYVKRADGSVAIFRVTELHSYLKSRFPTQGIYGPTPDAELRLITCGGQFDSATGHYLSNVIVFATLIR